MDLAHTVLGLPPSAKACGEMANLRRKEEVCERSNASKYYHSWIYYGRMRHMTPPIHNIIITLLYIYIKLDILYIILFVFRKHGLI